MNLQFRLLTKRPIAVRAAALGAILTLGAALAQPANAGCLDVPRFKKTSYLYDADSDYRLIKAGYEEDQWGPSFFQAPIVGLWAFTYTSKGNTAPPLSIPDGAPIDAGATTWFADGNEMTYSGVRNPIVGATCLGVWKRTGEYTYVLNHVGLSWNPQAASTSPPEAPGPASLTNPGGGPGAPGGPAFIKQYVTLAKDGQSYSGYFSITNLMPDGKSPAGPVIKGTIKATRITINSDTWEPTP
jgi:hypothetical protein